MCVALAKWGLAIALHFITPRTLYTLLAACLLETKLIIVSDNKRVLSAIVLSFFPLIRPFRCQTPVIPILPNKLAGFLEAPVPFLIGLLREPPAECDLSDILVFNVANGSFHRRGLSPSTIPTLPVTKKLYTAVVRMVVVVLCSS
jgi:DENN (AEX-3) domain